MALHLNNDAVKYALIALSSPFWLPFFKALLKEFNDALRDEGGLLGRTPTKSELIAMNKALGKFHSPMRSERWEDVERNERRARAKPKSQRLATKRPAMGTTQRGEAPGATVRRGFRTTR